MGFMCEELREEVEEALEDRMFDAMNNDRDTLRSVIRHGQRGIEDMNDDELMEEYELWNGHHYMNDSDKIEDVDDIDDPVYKKIVIAKNSQIVEDIVLKGEENENDDEGALTDQCADSYVGLYNR